MPPRLLKISCHGPGRLRHSRGGACKLVFDYPAVSLADFSIIRTLPLALSLFAVNLKVENLACERNDHMLFSGLSFDLNRGELVRIDGSNGSGKTTLLRTVCGLLPPDEGNVYWCDCPIREDRAGYFEELVFVGHKHGIKDELTSEENLDMDRALNGHRPGLSSHQAMERLGLNACAGQPCRQLSAGQRQRLALARLLVTDACLWVLDEPLTALDRETQSIVRDLLLGHLGNGGMALVTSHQELNCEDHTQRTIRLGNG